MSAPFDSYTVVGFRHGEKVLNIEGLSVDAAREVAQVHAVLGDATRIHAEHHDYIETFCPHGETRTGTFGEAMLVSGDAVVCCRAAQIAIR